MPRHSSDQSFFKKLSYFGGFFTLIFFFYSCGESVVDERSLTAEEKIKMVGDEINNYLVDEPGPFSIEETPVTTTEYIKKYYSSNRVKWYNGKQLSNSGMALLDFLSKSHYYGLDSSFYHTERIRELLKLADGEEDFTIKSKQIAQTEILLFDGLFLFATHVSNGFIDPETMSVVWKKDSLKTDLVEMAEKFDGDTLIHEILKLQPHYFEYRDLISSLKTYLDSNKTIIETSFEFADVKKDSAKVGEQVRERLVELGYLADSLKQRDTSAVKALKAFQLDHSLDDDGKIGKFTLQMLSESDMDRLRRAGLALEKWRWKRRGKEFQVRLNIPAYEMNIIRNDSIIHRARAVTGLTDKQTPELKAKMKWVTLHPYWHLPHSISSTEFLWSVQRDTSYMRKAGYKVFTTKNETVDVTAINWKKLSKDYFPYKIRQEGGYGNSLGLIVFHFPNIHDVYMHDSPAKYLFKRNTRAFSHGCMRIQDPFKMGEYIIKNDRPKDTINADTLKVWALRGYEQRLNLKTYIPVEVDYISVSADTTGKVIFHLDVYKRDEKYLHLFFPKKTQKSDIKEEPSLSTSI